MRQRTLKNLAAFFFGLCVGMGLLTGQSHAISVTCIEPTVMIPAGSTTTVNLDCTFTGATAGSLLGPISGTSRNRLRASAISNFTYFTATFDPTVTSPDGTVTGIVGTATGGFTGTIQAPTATVRFTYTLTAAVGVLPVYSVYSPGLFPYAWRVQDASNTVTLGSGLASTTHIWNITPIPASVSCSSSAGSAPPGGGTVTLNVDCVMTGGTGEIYPSESNAFTPATIVFSNGSNTLTGTLQPDITSPNSTVGPIDGTASGFQGTASYSPLTIRAQYKATTVSTTPAGIYTSPPVTFTWSTL